MGRPKLALPLGDKTVLELVIDALRQAKIEHALVVLGPHVAELAALARNAGAHVLLLDEETPDMRSTTERGLRWLEEKFQPQPEDSWLLLPADHPTLDPEVVCQLIAARARSPQYSVVIPTFQGRRGHPTLLAWKHAARIRTFAPGLGLNLYVRQQAAEVLELPVASDVSLDLDTPEEYRALTLASGTCQRPVCDSNRALTRPASQG
jgi:molybdenum cofactor cytidylyltransferase